MGAYAGQFEQAIEDYTGSPNRHVVAANTGHSALYLAMMLIDLKPGDEFITPSFNNSVGLWKRHEKQLQTLYTILNG